ncbi:Cytochrome c oxidase assembly protein cox15 [Podila verticillata]|nr:Cytochrome c oxidase assembly protein cox15 [Podila verticillata]
MQVVPVDDPKCLFAEDTVKVNYPFALHDKRDLSLAMFPYVKEKRVYSNRAEYSFPSLELCVVTGPEQECSTNTESECIQDKGEYRIRVHSPIQGYFNVSQTDLVIDADYSHATIFQLIPSDGQFILDDPNYLVLGNLLRVSYPFAIDNVNHGTPIIANSNDNDDILTKPDTQIRPMGGRSRDPDHFPLELCVVGPDEGSTRTQVRVCLARDRVPHIEVLVQDSYDSGSVFGGAVHEIVTLVFITAISGAFVAALDASLVYDKFPLMVGHLMPPVKELFDSHYVHKDDHPTIGLWRNMFDNQVTIQFNHRVLATTTFTAVSSLFLYSRGLPLPLHVRLGVNVLMGVTCCQVGLGIATLLYMVPVSLGTAHHAGSLTLLTSALYLMHSLKKIPIVNKMPLK